MKPCALVGLAALLVASPSAAVPRIHEVFYDAVGADAPHVFTELFGSPGESLAGFLLVGIDGGTGLVYRSIDLTGAVIPQDGLLVLATARAVGDLLRVRDFIADVDWQNGPDAVQLWSPLGVVIDALQYGESGGPHAGEGSPAPDVLAGFSLTRDGWSRDTGVNRSDFAVAEPTPGGGLAELPEPATAALLGLGLLGTLTACRWPPSGRRAQAGERLADLVSDESERGRRSGVQHRSGRRSESAASSH